MDALPFPIHQSAILGRLIETEVVFNEKDVPGSFSMASKATVEYFLDKRFRREYEESGFQIYLKKKLEDLNTMVKADTMFSSSITDILDNENFKTIVSFGEDIVPSVLNRLTNGDHYLVWALNLITGRKMSDNSISLSEAARLWISWGRSNKMI